MLVIINNCLELCLYVQWLLQSGCYGAEDELFPIFVADMLNF